jgi:hypothetical protein
MRPARARSPHDGSNSARIAVEPRARLQLVEWISAWTSDPMRGRTWARREALTTAGVRDQYTMRWICTSRDRVWPE